MMSPSRLGRLRLTFLLVSLATTLAVIGSGGANAQGNGTAPNEPDTVSDSVDADQAKQAQLAAAGEPDVPPTGAGSDPTLLAMQEDLRPIYTAVEELGRTDPAFSAVVMSRTDSELTIFRTDEDSPVQELDYRNLIPASTAVRFEGSPLSDRVFQTVREFLRENLATIRADFGVRLTGWSRDTPGGALRIDYDPAFAKPDVRLLEAIPGATAETVFFQQGTVIPLVGRLNDPSPYYGGSRVKFPNFPGQNYGEVCSNGFSVRSTNPNYASAYYQTLAFHCTKPSDLRVWSFTNEYMGPITTVDPARDIGFVKVSDANHTSSPWIYEGGYPNNTRAKKVVGSITPGIGGLACLSGSFTYAVCNVEITLTFDEWVVENYYTGVDSSVTGIRVSGSSVGTPIVANGDSGGPAFVYANNNTQVRALGIISASRLADEVTCPSYLAGHRCFWQALIVRADEIASVRQVKFTW